MIAIVDYGLGNIQAFANIYRRLGIDAWPARTESDLKRASRIILPGVGAFDWAITRLTESGLKDSLNDEVLKNGKPVLGVCVGMQMMARDSSEGAKPGLGWLKASVVKFETRKLAGMTHIPHMGWNDVEVTRVDPLLAGLHNPRFYFLHSYYMKADNLDTVIATSCYGETFVSVVRSGNIYGTQFHPEKSHSWGVQLLKNFAELT